MEKIIQLSIKRIQSTKVRFKRFLFAEINWDRRLIAIKGARGTGKTTLILQYIQETYGNSDQVVYTNLDNIYFTKNSLSIFVDDFVKFGGKYLFLDEVHKYPNWSREIKNIYDNYPDLKIVFTGSSILEIDKAEVGLSRRAMVYILPVLSIREFITIKYNINFPAYKLDVLLQNHKAIANQIHQQIKPLQIFSEYAQYGAYPFFMEAQNDYQHHLERIINIILENDLPSSTQIDHSSIFNLKKLLLVISESVPFQPNISKLSLKVGVTRETIIKYLSYLERAHLIKLLRSNTKGISKMNKPDKIYFNDSNLMFALNYSNVNIGSVRETFFYSQLSVSHNVELPKKSDFVIDDKYFFEIGGKNKSKKQIQDLPNAYIVADDIEFGMKNKVPLWLFGFLY